MAHRSICVIAVPVDGVDDREPIMTSIAKSNEGALDGKGKRMHVCSNPGKETLLYLILVVILLFSLKQQIFHQSGFIRPVQLTAHIPLVSMRPFVTPIQSKLQLRVHHIRLAAIRSPLSRKMESEPLESTLPGPQKTICNTGRRCDSTLFVEFGMRDVAPDILYELFAVVICFLGNMQPEIKLRKI